MKNLTITITDVNAGLKGYMKYSLQHCVDNTINELSLNERMAIITHYLHNQGTVFGEPYEKMAIKLIDDLNNWKVKMIK